MLWVLTNYLYIYSLRVLGCTEVMALFATNVCFIYLLSWVVLHEQFVGIRVSLLAMAFLSVHGKRSEQFVVQEWPDRE